jgi:[protein-PII] uridylyltransferase
VGGFDAARVAALRWPSRISQHDVATAVSAHGGNIEVVLIDTQAHKAIDVFYVTADSGKLTAEKQAAIRVAVEQAAGV